MERIKIHPGRVLAVDGETYVIRGVEWLLRKDGAGDAMAR